MLRSIADIARAEGEDLARSSRGWRASKSSPWAEDACRRCRRIELFLIRAAPARRSRRRRQAGWSMKPPRDRPPDRHGRPAPRAAGGGESIPSSPAPSARQRQPHLPESLPAAWRKPISPSAGWSGNTGANVIRHEYELPRRVNQRERERSRPLQFSSPLIRPLSHDRLLLVPVENVENDLIRRQRVIPSA
jgi:hypothetical protein